MSGGGEIRTKIRSFSEIETKNPDWLWPDRFPLGMLSLVVGIPGVGKSTLSMYMAAQLSTGRPWADCPGQTRKPASSILLTMEDPLDFVVKPRLDAAEANTDKIFVVDGAECNGKDYPLDNLTSNMKILEMAMEEIPDLKLVVIDPISAYMEGKNENRNSEVREFFNPLVKLAEDRGVAIVGVHHLNKNQDAGAAARVLGSTAFTATPRAIWLAHPDPDQAGRVFLVKFKDNIGLANTGLAYNIDSVQIPLAGGKMGSGSRCLFEPKPIYETCAELLAPVWKEQGRPRKQETASDWLRGYLEDGEKDMLDVIRDGEAAGFSKRTIDNVKKKVGVQSVLVREGVTGQVTKSMWSLKPDEWKDL